MSDQEAAKALDGWIHRDEGDSHIYVVAFDQFVKIGVSKNWRLRVLTLQRNLPALLTVLAVLNGGRDIERKLHERFDNRRLTGEWFERAGNVARWIETGCKLNGQRTLYLGWPIWFK